MASPCVMPSWAALSMYCSDRTDTGLAEGLQRPRAVRKLSHVTPAWSPVTKRRFHRHGLQPEVLLLGLRRALPAHAYCGGPGPRAALDAGCDAPDAEREAVMDALDRVV